MFDFDFFAALRSTRLTFSVATTRMSGVRGFRLHFVCSKSDCQPERRRYAREYLLSHESVLRVKCPINRYYYDSQGCQLAMPHTELLADSCQDIRRVASAEIHTAQRQKELSNGLKSRQKVK